MALAATYDAEELVENLCARLHAHSRYIKWAAIAQGTGLTRATLWKIMKKEVVPTLESTLKIARWLDSVESPTSTQDEVSV